MRCGTGEPAPPRTAVRDSCHALENPTGSRWPDAPAPWVGRGRRWRVRKCVERPRHISPDEARTDPQLLEPFRVRYSLAARKGRRPWTPVADADACGGWDVWGRQDPEPEMRLGPNVLVMTCRDKQYRGRTRPRGHLRSGVNPTWLVSAPKRGLGHTAHRGAGRPGTDGRPQPGLHRAEAGVAGGAGGGGSGVRAWWSRPAGICTRHLSPFGRFNEARPEGREGRSWTGTTRWTCPRCNEARPGGREGRVWWMLRAIREKMASMRPVPEDGKDASYGGASRF